MKSQCVCVLGSQYQYLANDFPGVKHWLWLSYRSSPRAGVDFSKRDYLQEFDLWFFHYLLM